MSNTKLNNLLDNSLLHKDDKENIKKIFDILSEERQKYIIENFNEISCKIELSRVTMEKDIEKIKSKCNIISTKVDGNIEKKDMDIFK